MNDGPEESPSLFPGPPKSTPGVRRLNRAPLVGALVLVTAILGVMAYTVHERSVRRAAQARKERFQAPEAGDPNEILRNAPVAGEIGASIAAPTQPGTTGPVVLAEGQGGSGGPSLVDQARVQEAERRRQAQNAAYESALSADTRVAGPDRLSASVATEDPNISQSRAESPGTGGGGEYRQGDQRDKKAFLARTAGGRPDNNYLDGERTDPRSPWEVKQGTIIPAVMIGGVNSDLPGQLFAQVSQNVWDTATGEYLLIPQGSRLVGTYDSQVVAGQERVLVGWTRLVYPDASTLDLGSMPGADQAGYAGFHDQVNNHYVRLFGHAILMSAFAGGIQLAQPRPQPGETISAGQIMAGVLGQQLGQLGMEIARRNLQIQPTLEIRPGYRFHVSVTKDIVIRPWEG